jgi:hypothetical protein
MEEEPIEFKKDELNFKFRLIWRSYFQQGEGDLDYLQLVRDPDSLKQLPPHGIKNLEQSKQLYYENICRVCLKFEAYFKDKKNNLFTPQAIIRPGSTKSELQEPLFIALRRKLFPYPIPDLSGYVEKNNGNKGTKKQRLAREIDIDLTKIEHILVIDDVYSDGDTMSSIMSLLGEEKSFVIACPLRIDKSVHEFMKDIKNAQKNDLKF